jgi:Domain of unknown function (DUF6391)
VHDRRLGGRATTNGFSIAGPVSVAEIASACTHVSDVLRKGEELQFISRTCGSNMITALALGLTLLLVVTVVSVTLSPDWPIRAASFAFVLLLFVAFRHWMS